MKYAIHFKNELRGWEKADGAFYYRTIDEAEGRIDRMVNNHLGIQPRGHLYDFGARKKLYKIVEISERDVKTF